MHIMHHVMIKSMLFDILNPVSNKDYAFLCLGTGLYLLSDFHIF